MKSRNLSGIVRFFVIDLIRGTQIRKVLRELHAEQYYSKEQLEEITGNRLNRLFETAKSTTEYYRKFNNYSEVPVITKDGVRDNFNQLISSGYQGKMFSKGTGGSTGRPLLFLTTLESRSYLWACLILAWESAGYHLGNKVAFIAGTALSKSNFSNRVFHWLLNTDFYSAYTLDEDNIRKYLVKLKRTKAKVIFGYASAINEIAHYIKRNEAFSLPDLRGIVCTSEVLSDSCRVNIEEAFKVEVFNQYGCFEAGISAFECEHHRLHLISTKCKYEIDKNGNLYSTDLINNAFIMMRYSTGDRIELAEEKTCSCNRNFPVIEKVIGRISDVIVDAEKNVVHAAFFGNLFRDDGRVRQYQILYNKKGLTLYLNVELPASYDDYYDKYMTTIKKYLQFEEYQLVLNAPFIKAENAKHKYIINTEEAA
jgi:phenylacetate-CoA ligase